MAEKSFMTLSVAFACTYHHHHYSDKSPFSTGAAVSRTQCSVLICDEISKHVFYQTVSALARSFGQLDVTPT
jgi:hypothetical protein